MSLGRAIGLGLALASPAAASPTLFELVEWACGGDEPEGLDEQVAADCSMTLDEDDSVACDVVSGDPFACYASSMRAMTRTCLEASSSVTVSATTGAAGWEITGTATLTVSRTTTFEGDTCRTTSRPEGSGKGVFVRKAGSATLDVNVTFMGEGTVSFLGLGLFGADFTETCSASFSAPVRTTKKAVCCGDRIAEAAATEVGETALSRW